MHMFHPFVPCFCSHSIPVCSRKLSRAIHQRIFSHLAGAQINVYKFYLTLQTFLFWFLQIIVFWRVCLCFRFNTSEYTSVPCFIHLLSFYPSVLPQDQQSNHGPPSKRISSIILVCKSTPREQFLCWHTFMFV